MFETARLVVRDLAEHELEAILPVYQEDAGYLAFTSGFGGEPGRYELGSLQRDFAVARITPGRHVAGVYAKPGGEPVGVLDWLEENPADGAPWIGLVLIRPACRRRGFGTEVVDALLGCLQGTVRMAVIVRNETGLAFAERLGFKRLSSVDKRLNASEAVAIYERPSAVAAK